MKKMLIIFMLMIMMCNLTACGTNENSKPDMEDNKNNAEGHDKLTQESILNYPVSNVEDFDTEVVRDGLSISGCNSKDDVIVVPEEINGIPVVAISKYGMDSLNARAIVLPDTIEYIGYAAFLNCENMEYIHLGKGLKTIDEMAFSGCLSLKQAIIPNGTKKFFAYPFLFCESLEKIVIPASVTNIPYGIVFAMHSPNVVIMTPKGSAAEKVALKDGIKVEYIK